jgi:hypothetical protein
MLCWFFRFMISSTADSDRPIGPAANRHVARCVGCRQFLQSCRVMDVRLRSEAAKWQQGPERLSHQVLPNLVRLEPVGHRHRIRAALAAAACVAITAAALFYLSMSTPKPQLPPTTTGAIIPASTQWAAKWAEFIPNPLAAEAKRLTSDTESGIRFVVACLDVRPLVANVVPNPGESGPPPQPKPL